MQSTAQQFLIFEITGSAEYLGIVAAANGLPSWFLMLFGGVVADRFPRRKMLILTQAAMMLLAFILAALAFTNRVQPWHIVVLSFLLGVTNAFDAPARLALAPELVDREDLTNAIALNGSMFNTALIIGPTVGSLIYAAYGPAWCFFLNGLSFLAVIYALARMNLPALIGRPKVRASAFGEIIDGIRYVIHEPTIRIILALIAMFSLFGSSFATLMPAWAVNVLHGDEVTNGLLLSARGVGALIGALGLASLGRFNFRGKVLSAGLFIFPIALLAFSWVRWQPLALLLLTGVGGSMVFVFNISNSLIQTESPDEVRGRINGIYSLVFFGMFPVGSYLVGWIADRTSEPLALQIGAVILLAFSIILWLFFPRIRRHE
jgi:MFS family permease